MSRQTPGTTGSHPRPLTSRLESARVRYLYGTDTAAEALQGDPRLPSLRELAETTRLSLNTLERRSRKEDWPAQRQKAQEELRAGREARIQATLLGQEMQERQMWWTVAAEASREIRNRLPTASSTELASLLTALRKAQEISLVSLGKPKDGVQAPNPEKPVVGELDDWTIMRRARAGVPLKDL